PAVVAVLRVGVQLEAELADIEIDGLVLIADVETDHSDTFRHVTSSSLASSVASASSRRFSETEMLRSGRRAALTKQAGTRSRVWVAAWSRARNSPGLTPVMSRKVRPNVPRLLQPVEKQMSVIAWSVSRSKAVARSTRRVSR